jgi:hypothetical protein
VPHYRCAVPALQERLAADPRIRSAATIAGALAGCALLALVDPNEPGHYPTCPTRALLGIDCPACGTLRGIHALTHGHLLEALDNNLLLAVAVPWAMVTLALSAGPLLGRPARRLHLPPAVARLALAVVIVFFVARNLPIPAFGVLGSSAG